jgi:hypothetical protein
MIDDRDVWAAALLKVKRYDAMLLPAPLPFRRRPCFD